MTLRVYNTLSGKRKNSSPCTPARSACMSAASPFTTTAISAMPGPTSSSMSSTAICSTPATRSTYVRNYTDVDDKIINRAKERGIRSQELAEEFIRAFDEDMARPGPGPAHPAAQSDRAHSPDHRPGRASDRQGDGLRIGRRRLLQRREVSRLSQALQAQHGGDAGRRTDCPRRAASAIRWISPCGKPPSPASRPGSPPGGPAVPAGTSSARR